MVGKPKQDKTEDEKPSKKNPAGYDEALPGQEPDGGESILEGRSREESSAMPLDADVPAAPQRPEEVQNRKKVNGES